MTCRDRNRPSDAGSFRSLLAATVLGLALVCGAATGCDRSTSTEPASSEGDGAGPSTDEELVLRLRIWPGYAPDEYVEEFETRIEKTYGRTVKLEVAYTDGGANDFYDPIREKSVDVVTITHHLFKDQRFRFIAKELLLPLDLERIPNFTKLLPTLRKAEHISSEGRTFGVPICQGPYTLAYNQELIRKAPDSWEALWDPAYRGKYTLAANEYLYNLNITALALGYPRESLSNYDAMNNSEFKEKLRELTTNAASFWIGADKPEDLSGLHLAAVWGDSIGRLKRRGERWATVVPKEGVPFWIDNYAITWALADRPFLKKVAEEWINALLGREYQVEYVVRELSLVPVIEGVETALTADERARLSLDEPDGVRASRIVQPTLASERDRNGLKRLWEKAMEGVAVRVRGE